MLELVGVGKSFRDGNEDLLVLDKVSLRVERGTICVLMGPSGSGKTTLLGLCTTRLQPDVGQVLVDGRDINDDEDVDAVTGGWWRGLRRQHATAARRARYRRQTLGVIPQQPGLIAGVALWDQAAVKLTLDGLSLRRARRAVLPLLQRLELDHRLEHRPEQLSGGERQRLGIVRALANRPSVVTADEPTGSLDEDRSRTVLQLLRELCVEQQVAIVVATHDPLAAAYADDAVRLAGGRLLPLDLTADPAVVDSR